MDITTLITQGANIWLLMISAIMLGALHGLEPGHSKTMMASFIIAIKGTVWQAIMLGVAATISHTAVVWIIALAGLYFGAAYSNEVIEPYLQIISAIIILSIALWMIRQTYKNQHCCTHDNEHHDDNHHHHSEDFRIETEVGAINLSIFEEGQAPKFRLISNEIKLEEAMFTVKTKRDNNETQKFLFVKKDGFLESIDEIPEPHEFEAVIFITNNNEIYTHQIEFKEHSHEHLHEGLDIDSTEYQDAHELAHANDIKKRFVNKEVTNTQVLLFGLTGGLIPCPATITVLLLCLQLKKVAMGATLVLGFSIGLALTLVATGVIAALSTKYMSKKFTGFGNIVKKAPYFSGGLILCLGLYIGYSGLKHFL
ncbi:MAG: nickel/cobalt efflux transporter [Aliarcobacter sp.]|nr:nickel/cobalt efflux transporter [Aliarcobacter sp.]